MPEHHPGEPASTTGFYHEVNVFGTRTGWTAKGRTRRAAARCADRLWMTFNRECTRRRQLAELRSRLVPGVGHLPGAATPVSISARLPNEPGMADDADTERVTFTIANLRSINSKRLYALVDVEIRVAGLSFRIIGVQIQRGTGGLSVHLPTHRDVNGAWKPVVEMPEELREPLSDAVMGFLVDEGMAKPRWHRSET
jgi:DNA-binding cell septation regulator SpoVG